MAPKSDYGQMVKQAEEAVASIKDSDLRTIAFGKILDTLLGQEREASAPQSASPSNVSIKRKPRRTASRATQKRGGPKGYVEELIEESFFKTPKTLSAIRAELGNRGHHIPMTSLSAPMMLLCRERKLRRQKAKDGKKQIYTYSRW